ncbi:AroM family protein [Youngiibacter fragilis]
MRSHREALWRHEEVPDLRDQAGVIVPGKAQEEQAARSGVETEVASGSPYIGMHELEAAARRLEGKDVSFICLDCMGCTAEMKRRVSETEGRPVILQWTLIARLAD